jgi:asparagine synthase (glutamine-hydrolysing)
MSAFLVCYTQDKEILDKYKASFNQSLRKLAHRGFGKPYTYEYKNFLIGGYSSRHGSSVHFEDGLGFYAVDGYVYNKGFVKGDSKGMFSKIDSEGLPQLLSKSSANISGTYYSVKQNKLYIFRDQLGQKPIVYYQDASTIIVSSETKALNKIRGVSDFDTDILADVLSYRCPVLDKTGFKGVSSCPPGSYISFNLSKTIKRRVYSFWKPSLIKESYSTYGESKDATRKSLVNAISQRYNYFKSKPNVLLSGGLDSSLISAIFVKDLGLNINTYNIGFPSNQDLSEHTYANKVSKLLKTNHTYIPLSWGNVDLISTIEELFDKVDRPVADPGILPTYILFKSLGSDGDLFYSGDCVDSLQGIGKYIYKYNLYHKLLPHTLRKSLYLATKFSKNKRAEFYAEGSLNSLEEMFLYKIGCFHNTISNNYYVDKHSILKNKYYSSSVGPVKKSFDKNSNIGRKYSQFSFDVLLPERYAPKLDFASMLNHVEVISPFSDYNFMYNSLKIPYKFKNVKGENKYILKLLAEEYLPNELVYRKKAGMYPPYVSWFANEMFGYLQDTLLSKSKFICNYMDKEYVNKVLVDHKGGIDYSNHIWVLLTLELWGRKNFY